MATNIFWGHIGTLTAAILAGLVSYVLYPNIKYCFLVIGTSALLAVVFSRFLPQGDRLMGRGFLGKVAIDEEGHLEKLREENTTTDDFEMVGKPTTTGMEDDTSTPQAATYWEVFSDKKTYLLCLTGFFFQ